MRGLSAHCIVGVSFAALFAPGAMSAEMGKSQKEKILFSQEFTDPPSETWLHNPIGPVYGFNYSKFGMRRGPFFEVTHEKRGGIRNSPFIRARAPNGYPVEVGSDHYFAPDIPAAFGEKRMRAGNWRGCTRWSGKPSWSGERQKLYYQTLDGFIVSYRELRGGIEGRLTANGSRSANLRTTEVVTNVTKNVDLAQRAIVFTSGRYAGEGYLIEKYDSRTGKLWLFPGYDYERAAPVADTTFVIGPIQGEKVSGKKSGATGNAFGVQGSYFRVLNESGSFSPGETVEFESSGMSATVSNAKAKGRAFSQNVYIVRGQKGSRHYGGRGLELVWGLINIGDQYRFGHLSPFNDAPEKKFPFYKEDHDDQWWCLEEQLDYDQNPWRLRAWLTTEWGAANLPIGTAARRPGTTGLDGDGIPEFNDFLYIDFHVTMPPLQHGEGVLLTWGGYAGEAHGAYQDFDSFALSRGKIGHPF